MPVFAIVIIISICVAGLFLLISGIWLMFQRRPVSPGEATEASLKEVIRLNVPAQALLVLVGAALLVSGGYLGVTRWQTAQGSNVINSSPASRATASPFAVTTTSPSISPISTPSPASATLTSPNNGVKVSKRDGFVARGTVASLGSYTVWILDYDGGYTVDQEAVVTAGLWSATDQPLGDPSDKLPYNLTMVAVMANPYCADRLSRIQSTSNDYTLNLPGGCKIVGRIIVDVSKP